MSARAGIWVRTNGQQELRDNLRNAIKEAGLSLAAAARAANVKYSQFYPALNGSGWIPRETVEALATVLEVSADELLGGSIYREDRDRYRDFAHVPPDVQARRQRHETQATVRQEELAQGRERAICCGCGALRTYSTRGLYEYDERNAGGQHLRNGRRTRTLLCLGACGEKTVHALLLPLADPNRDSAEQADQAPTREAAARKELQLLVDRISAFGVDIHFHKRGKKTRAKGFVSLYEYDESKSRWRIELDPNAPSRINVGQLSYIWKRIATNDHGDIDWNPEDGVVIAPSSTDWGTATDELMDDLTRFLSVERRRMVADLNDQIAQQGSPTDSDHDEESWT